MPSAVIKEVSSLEFSEVSGARGAYIKWILSPKDGAPNFSMRLIRLEAGGTIPEHSHPWEHEIYVLKGIGRIKVGEETYRISEGKAVLIPPSVGHEYHAESEMLFLCLIPNSGVPPEHK